MAPVSRKPAPIWKKPHTASITARGAATLDSRRYFWAFQWRRILPGRLLPAFGDGAASEKAQEAAQEKNRPKKRRGPKAPI
jgi:hypothetical protein